MRFDSEPFRIQCSHLQQCQNSRDVLIACSSVQVQVHGRNVTKTIFLHLYTSYLQYICNICIYEHNHRYSRYPSLPLSKPQANFSHFSTAKMLLLPLWTLICRAVIASENIVTSNMIGDDFLQGPTKSTCRFRDVDTQRPSETRLRNIEIEVIAIYNCSKLIEHLAGYINSVSLMCPSTSDSP